MALTFSSYVLQPFFASDCEVPKIAQQLLAAATICKLIIYYDVLIVFSPFIRLSYDRELTTNFNSIINRSCFFYGFSPQVV